MHGSQLENVRKRWNWDEGGAGVREENQKKKMRPVWADWLTLQHQSWLLFESLDASMVLGDDGAGELRVLVDAQVEFNGQGLRLSRHCRGADGVAGAGGGVIAGKVEVGRMRLWRAGGHGGEGCVDGGGDRKSVV